MNDPAIETETLTVDKLDEAIARYTTELGYRLEMIVPADSPREALLSNGGKILRLVADPITPHAFAKIGAENFDLGTTNTTEWVAGRAGMEYRDLIPGRLGGKVIASHIRLTKGGEVADYVHYHKIGFQMIYCLAGRIRVVYEDQGDAFWLEPGDCVLQPPEIRHRVLEADAGSQVIEITSPALHETWADHDLQLPTAQMDPAREFCGQRFVRHISADAKWDESEFVGFLSRDTGIRAATNGLADVRVLRAVSDASFQGTIMESEELIFCFVLEGTARCPPRRRWPRTSRGRQLCSSDGNCFFLPGGRRLRIALCAALTRAYFLPVVIVFSIVLVCPLSDICGFLPLRYFE